mgnify:CR=1 FL=1
MNKTYGADVRADNFYMTCGAAASLVISLKAIVEDASDEVILVAPFFPEYTVFVQNAGAKSVILPPDTEHFQISLDAMEQAITPKTRAVIINSPNNPSGVVYSAETFEKLPLSLNENRRKSAIRFTSFPMNRIVKSLRRLPILYVPKFYRDTIICYSYSKSLSLPGERIGYILVPDCVTAAKEVYTAVCGAGRFMGFVCAPHLFQDVILKCMGQTSDVDVYDQTGSYYIMV